jgi:hypothetical protein
LVNGVEAYVELRGERLLAAIPLAALTHPVEHSVIDGLIRP